jgi:uncharacterized damage-inducible protein DinB
MRLIRVLLSMSFVLSASSAHAQSASDPISGTWTGDIGLDETTRHALTLQLRFDGTSAISGTITGPGPADLKGGTFDPKTGAFKLEVDAGDAQPNIFVFEGVAVKGMATGRVTNNNQQGTFRLTRGAATTPTRSDGVIVPPELQLRFDEVSAWVTKAAQGVPADKYTYQPNQSVRSFGQLIGHIVDGSNYYCGKAAGGQAQWSEATEKGATDKATVVQKLTQALAACSALYGGKGQPGPLVDNVAHTSLHYGNIITYMRLLGLTPPSS